MKESLIIPSDCIPVIDAHCHIFPNAIAEKAMINVGRFYNLPTYTKGTLAELYAVRSGVSESERKIVMQVIFFSCDRPSTDKKHQ